MVKHFVYEWQASGGRSIPVSYMTDEHLVNAINWLEGRSSCTVVPNSEQIGDGYFYLRTEAIKRGLRWRSYAGRSLLDGEINDPDVRQTTRASLDTRVKDLIGHHVKVVYRQDGKLGSIFFGPQQQPQSQPQEDKTVSVGSLKVGDRFIRVSHQQEMIKCSPVGVFHQALLEHGFMCIEGGLYRSPTDNLERCAVTNIRTGMTYFIPTYERVIPGKPSGSKDPFPEFRVS